jgi:hypothetical protein
MHTDAGAFLALCAFQPLGPENVPTLTKDEIEVLAAEIHETWRDLGKRYGWLEKKDDVAYKDVTDSHRKQSNREAAERMGPILALGWPRPKKKMDVERERAIQNHLEYHLDLLAEAEHTGWMDWHLRLGWHYAEKRDDAKRLHSSLLPFSQLKEVDKNKDRTQVRHYPTFAKLAKKTIVFIQAT